MAEDEDTMTELFTCPICMEYMDSKIYICLNGHSICYKCGIRVDKCPSCKGRMDPSRRNYALENAAKLFRKLEGKVNENNVVVSEEIMRKKIPTDFNVRERQADPDPYWQPAYGGEVPENAFPGGHDYSTTLYIARAEVGGGLLVGKLHPGYKLAYIPWNCREHVVSSYEVLCNFTGYWSQCHGDDIPENAFVGGRAENGEPLYIGRAEHHYGSTLAVGKVHPSHKVLYISWGGREFAYRDYEILCRPTYSSTT